MADASASKMELTAYISTTTSAERKAFAAQFPGADWRRVDEGWGSSGIKWVGVVEGIEIHLPFMEERPPAKPLDLGAVTFEKREEEK